MSSSSSGARSLKKRERDRISSLPSDLKTKILTHLPIRDAVRTSALSSVWKHEWSLMPDLCVSECDFASPEVFVRFVDMLLLLRAAPIRKFSITTSSDSRGLVEGLDRWMVILSRNKIEEAELVFPRNYQVHSKLFSWAFLKKLEFECCHIKVPTNFRGFELLTSLNLIYFSASEDDLERLILSCPMLKILDLLYLEGAKTNLNVSAPNLEQLNICGRVRKLNLQTPHLNKLDFRHRVFEDDWMETDAIIDMTVQQRESNFRSVFGQCFHNITEIGLDRSSLMYLGYGHLGNNLPGTFHNLKCVDMGFCPTCPFETTSALRLLRSAHNIEMLKIMFWPSPVVDRPCPPGLKVYSFEDCSFPHLRILKISHEYNYLEEELAVLKHLLLVSPSLERVFFTGYDDQHHLKEFTVYLKAIVRFRRASAKAEIIFSPGSLYL